MGEFGRLPSRSCRFRARRRHHLALEQERVGPCRGFAPGRRGRRHRHRSSRRRASLQPSVAALPEPGGERQGAASAPDRAHKPRRSLSFSAKQGGRSGMPAKDAKKSGRQLLHLVFGGELKSLDRTEFSNLKALDIVGIYPNYAQAYDAWKEAAHRTVDDAHMRYFIVHLHRLLDPEHETGAEKD